MIDFGPTLIFVACFGVSACAGLAALLRSGNVVNKLSVLNATLNSGLLGLGISLLWYQQYVENVYTLVGLCLLSGLGGMATVDFAIDFAKRAVTALKVGAGAPIEKDKGKNGA